MSTTEGATLALLALGAGGVLPALALARLRIVVVALAPLCGAVLASLAVTAMTAFGWSVAGWYVTLSALCGLVVVVTWWRRPSSLPRSEVAAADRSATRWTNVAALAAGVVVCIGCLSVLKAQSTGYDARDIWLVHPLWYLQGRAVTLATLRGPTYVYGHPPYPPLVGGSVALAWLIAGAHSVRLGVVLIALLNALAILAAGTAMVELGTTLAASVSGARRRAAVRAAGACAMVGLLIVSFDVAWQNLANGYADVLWSAVAVGAVAYGLVLPVTAANLGTAAALTVAAGVTKLEGSVVGAVIIALIGLRLLLSCRPWHSKRSFLRAGSLVVAVWALIGLWPLVIKLLGARADVPFGGPRRGTNGSRLDASLHVALQTAGSHFYSMAGIAVIAVLGALLLRSLRSAAGLGNDLWAWLIVALELVIIFGAYVVGPGHVIPWVKVTIKRTTTFPLLEAWWIATTWAMLAVRNNAGERDVREAAAEAPAL